MPPLIDKPIKTRQKMAPLIDNPLKTRQKMTPLTDNPLKTHQKIHGYKPLAPSRGAAKKLDPRLFPKHASGC